MGRLRDYIESEIARKKDKKSCRQWLEEVTDKIPSCTLATHVGKFTNPNSKVNAMDISEGLAGYVTTGGTALTADVIVSTAAYLPTAKLLRLALEDGRSVWEHLHERSDFIAGELAELGIEVEDILRKAEGLFSNKVPEQTEDCLRQVYFPVAEGHYELLTVMPSSSLLLEMGRRIRRMREEYYECHDDKNEAYGGDCSLIPNLTNLNYGGTKPQNISLLNSEAGPGGVYMLEALPPVWKERERQPKRDFFREIVRKSSIRDNMDYLKKLKKSGINNLKTRTATENTIKNIVDKAVMKAYALRELGEGWSDEAGELPEAQRLWLDDKHQTERRNQSEWIDKISDMFAHWVISAYSQDFQKDGLPMADEEYQQLYRGMSEVLQEERRLS